MDRGVALLNQWKVSEGIEDFNKSIELYRKLVSDGTVDEKKLVKVISFRAAALNKNGNLDKAIQDCNHAIAFYTKAVSSGIKDLEQDLANVSLCRGSIHETQGKVIDCVQDYTMAADLYTKLVAKQKKKCHRGQAIALYYNARALNKLKRPKEALDWLKRSIAVDEKMRRRALKEKASFSEILEDSQLRDQFREVVRPRER